MRNEAPAVTALVVAVALIALAVVRAEGPTPVDAADGFSAVAAKRVVDELVGDGAPHPVGSARNARTRDQILARLRALGYAPQVQRQPICSLRAECATVENIVAVAPGATRDAVMVACHYDSVPAGPGAGDDASGVALTLELARLVQKMERRNSVIFLIDDGEESGLLGAEAFVRHHPLAKDVRAVINVEARGTSGLSHMFETSENHGWLIDIMRAQLRRPSSTSIFYSIYQRLPNDTDLTVFKRAGLEGVNFGFIADPLRYHTPDDSAANLSIPTLQHQGQNAWEMLQGLVRHDMTQRGGGERTYFDALGFFLLAWPASWNVVLLALVFAALIAAATIHVRRSTQRLIGAVIASLGTIVIAAAGAYGTALLVKAPTSFIATPLVSALSVAAIAFSVASAFRAVAATSTPVAMIGALGLAGIALGAASVALLPGATYVGLVIAAAAAGALLIYRHDNAATRVIAAAALVVPTTIVTIPLVILLPDGMGTMTLPAVGFAASLIALAVAAFAETRRLAVATSAIFAVVSVVLLIAAARVAPYTTTERRPVTLTHFHDADAKSSYWLTAAKPLPAAIAKNDTWTETRTPFRGFGGSARYMRTPAGASSLPAPEFTVTADVVRGEQRHVKIRVKSARGAYKFVLVLDRVKERFIAARMAGVPIELQERYWDSFADGAMRLGARGLTPEGIELELIVRGSDPVTGYVYDTSFGVTDTRFTKLRTATETAIQDGDVTIVKREVRF